MPSRRPHLCIFGDSHFACLKQAIKEELVDVPDIDLEFWGNTGHRFRRIGWRNERIEGLDEFTTHRFAKLNERQRTFLSSTDFDAILFAGCRIPVQSVFAELLDTRAGGRMPMSAGVERRIIRDHLEARMPYIFAQRMAAQSCARILVSPISFDVAPFPDNVVEGDLATERAHLWARFEEVMSSDGIVLVPQPDETVSHGCYTAVDYASEGYERRGDRTHKNEEFGAILLERVFEQLEGLNLAPSGTEAFRIV